MKFGPTAQPATTQQARMRGAAGTCDLKIDLIRSERIGLQARCCHAGNPHLGFMNCLSVSPTLRHSRHSPAPNFSYLFHKGLVDPHDPCREGKAVTLENKRRRNLSPRWSAVGREVKIQVRSQRSLPAGDAADNADADSDDDEQRLCPDQLPCGERSYDAEVIRMSAIRMKALVQGRAGCKSAENEHQHNGERRRHGFRSPAKTQTDMDLTHGLAKRQPQARLECKRRKSGHPRQPANACASLPSIPFLPFSIVPVGPPSLKKSR